jgi:hypothetical protein
LLSGLRKVPFNKTSLLEIVIDPKEIKLEISICCLAKIGRIAKGNSKGLEKYKSLLGTDEDLLSVMGIYFSEFEHLSGERLWFEYIRSLTVKSP